MFYTLKIEKSLRNAKEPNKSRNEADATGKGCFGKNSPKGKPYSV
jgi:hypothetical protein